MSDYTVNIDLPDHKLGDKWLGIARIGPILIDGLTPNDSLTRIRMTFANTRGERFVIDSEDNLERDAEVSITDAVNWQGEIPSVMDFLATSGDWSWDMEFYQGEDTSPMTLYKGVLTVNRDVR